MSIKNILKIVSAILLIVTIFVSCSDDGDKVTSVPKILSASLSPAEGEIIVYGDSISFTANFEDKETNLSTVELTLYSGTTKLDSTSYILWTKGANNNISTITKKVKVPFIPNCFNDQKIFAVIKLINVDGSESIQTINGATVKNPIVYPNLYMYMKYDENGNTISKFVKLTRIKGSFSYCSELATWPTAFKAKVVNDTNTKTYIWIQDEKNSTKMKLGKMNDDFFDFVDPFTLPDTVFFDAEKFSIRLGGSKVDPVSINGTRMTYIAKAKGTDAAYSVSSHFKLEVDLEQNQELTITGINTEDMIHALDPDFFELKNGKWVFTGLTGTYLLRFPIDKKFMYVEQTGKVYPDALWCTGVGLGKPSHLKQKTLNWAFTESKGFGSGLMCKKISDGKFQLTVYMQHGPNADKDDESKIKFKFFKTGGSDWADDDKYAISAGDFSLPSGLTSDGSKFKNILGTSNWGDGIYRLIIDIDAKTITSEKIE